MPLTRAARPSFAFLALLASLAPGGAFQAAQTARYEIDAAASSVTIHVGRAGILGFAGHIHEIVAPEVSGFVVVNADHTPTDVSLTFKASALKVVDKNEAPEVVAEVQRTMLGPRVLDAEQYPVIVYKWRTMKGPPRGAGGAFTLDGFEGDLTLHGVTRRVVARLAVQITADVLKATGSLTIKQTEFGIKPVTAAGGTIRVRDELDLAFGLVARRN